MAELSMDQFNDAYEAAFADGPEPDYRVFKLSPEVLNAQVGDVIPIECFPILAIGVQFIPPDQGTTRRFLLVDNGWERIE
jgi:hypothetical protein